MPFEASDYDRIIAPIEKQMIRSIWSIVRDGQDAEEAMQDSLATILEHSGRVCTHDNPQALVLKICIDAAHDVLRRKYRSRKRRVDYEFDPPSPAREPCEEAAGKEQQAEILRAISRLPRRQATATLLRIVEDRSYDEIAAVLGCTQPTARRHVAAGRDRLRRRLSHLAWDK